MIFSLKRGSSTPTNTDLYAYELGWQTTDKELYINDNGTIRRLNSKITLNGIINEDASFYAPQNIVANRVLKSKSSWTNGTDPFEYIAIDSSVTEDSNNLITSDAVFNSLTSLQSTINTALDNKISYDDLQIGTLAEIENGIVTDQRRWSPSVLNDAISNITESLGSKIYVQEDDPGIPTQEDSLWFEV